MIMSSYVYNRAKPDGNTIGLFGSSHGMQAVLAPPEMVKYDLLKMPIIWSVAGIPGSPHTGLSRREERQRSADQG